MGRARKDAASPPPSRSPALRCSERQVPERACTRAQLYRVLSSIRLRDPRDCSLPGSWPSWLGSGRVLMLQPREAA